jgi:hypothetical protein
LVPRSIRSALAASIERNTQRIEQAADEAGRVQPRHTSQEQRSFCRSHIRGLHVSGKHHSATSHPGPLAATICSAKADPD